MNSKTRINSVIYFFWCLAGILTLRFLYFPRECSGYSGIYNFLISAIIFILILFVIILRQVLKFRIDHRRIDITAIGILTIFLIAYFFIPYLITRKPAGKKIFEAVTSQCKCGDLSILTLNGNNTFHIKMTQTEFVCSYSGKYRLSGDTLFLQGNIGSETQNIYCPVYLMDFRDSLLIPRINGRFFSVKGEKLTINYFSRSSFRLGEITARK